MSNLQPARRILVPIRARLALWYSLLLGLVLVLFSFLVYSTLTISLQNEVDGSLQERAAKVAFAVKISLLDDAVEAERDEMLGTEREGLAIKSLVTTDKHLADGRERMRGAMPRVLALREHGPPLDLRPLHRESPGQTRIRALRVQAAGASAKKDRGAFSNSR